MFFLRETFLVWLFFVGTSFCKIDDILVEFIVDAIPNVFSPSRISVQLCIEEDDVIGLSKKMSKNFLSHDIRNSFLGLDGRLYDNLEHQNLYVLDLDCDYAFEVLAEANSNKMFIGPTKWLILQDARNCVNFDNETNTDSTYTDSYSDYSEIFKEMDVYPDSDVVIASRTEKDFLELLSVYRQSPHRGAIIEDRGNWSSSSGIMMKNYDVASRRRRNLNLTPLKSCIVLIDPDTINHLTTLKRGNADLLAKANYRWLQHLIQFMNATVTVNITHTWGYDSGNGSWSGMIGMLQRHEIDIGGTATFLTQERIGVVAYVQLYAQFDIRFVFRQPLLSTVSNIFVLPFHHLVWIAIAVLLILIFALLYVSMRWEFYRVSFQKSASYWTQSNPGKPTVSDNFLVILGAFAQQGYSYEPFRVPSRIVTLMLLIAALSLYTSYTANIVALLQSTTNSIQTLSDLLHSPLKMGAINNVYNKHYFKSFKDPVRKAILKEKIEAKGQKPNWLSLEEGVQRLRNGLFAFHAPLSYINYVIEETFQEEEKCGLTEIDCLGVVRPLMVTQVRSPYLEIIKNGALLLHETGLKFRDEYRLYIRKSVCHGQTGFISIGLTECYFALVIMGYGVLLTLLVLLLELLWHKWHKDGLNNTTERLETMKNID